MKGFLNQRLLWVGGKGGVGKTTVAASLALLAARRRRRVLVVSTDPAHSLGDVFDLELSDEPRCVQPNLDAMEIDPDGEVERHLRSVTSQMRRFTVPRMMDEMERQMRLSRQSPGTQEAALLERLTRLMMDDSTYELIIFDTAPTGHTLRLLSLPEAMAAWTDGLLSHTRKSEELGKVLRHLTPKSGQDVNSPFSEPDAEEKGELGDRAQSITETLKLRRRMFHQARRRIKNSAECGFLFVLTPERLPILETVRSVQALQEADIPVAGTLINRVIPEQVDGDFLRQRRAQEAVYLKRIDTAFAEYPRPRLPLLPRDVQGIAALEELAVRLEGLGF